MLRPSESSAGCVTERKRVPWLVARHFVGAASSTGPPSNCYDPPIGPSGVRPRRQDHRLRVAAFDTPTFGGCGRSRQCQQY
jgi:hypothetical protein